MAPAAARGPRSAQKRDGNGLLKDTTATERQRWTLQALQGYTVRAQVRDGAVYEGVFHGAQLDGPLAGFSLKMARLVEGKPADPQPAEPDLPAGWNRTLLLPLADVAQLTASDVRLGAEDLGGLAASDELAGFGTDASISRGRGGMVGRELKRWQPSADDAPLEGLEGPHVGGSGGAWDQFAVNRGKFGVQTTFQEDLYTTKLDKGKSRISEAEAARLAAEIMSDARSGGAAAANAHIAEERGMEVNDSGMDEEDRYSSVLRQPASQGVARPIPISNGSPVTGAWRNAGSSLAAISGRSSSGGVASSSGPRPIPGRSPAIDMPSSPVDTRREYNKVAMQMGAPVRKKDSVATSPYGTPKGARSPLSSSPLVHDAAAMEALNLNPGVPRVDHRARAAFEEFKAREAADKAKRERDELRERLRTFSSDGGKGPSSASASESALSPSEHATPLSDAAAAPSPPASAAGSVASGTPPTNGKSAGAGGKAEAAGADSAAKGAAVAESGGQPSTPGSAMSAASKLNPFAKSFSFNPGAKEFRPGPSGGGGGSLNSASVPAASPGLRPRNGVHPSGLPGGGRPPHGSGGGNSLSRQSVQPPRGGHSRSGSSSGLALPPGGMLPGGMHQRMGSGGGGLPMGPPGHHLGMVGPFSPGGDHPGGMGGPPHMERTSSGPRPPGPGMGPMPMSMQGGAPVQMPQGMYMPPGQPMYGPPVMMPGSPGQYMMYPGGPRPQFVNVMPAFGHVVAYPGGPPGSPGGPPPAGMRPQMYQGGPAPFPGPHPGGMHSGSMPPPGMMGRPSQQMGPPPGHHMQQHPGGHGHTHSRSSSFGGPPPGGLPPGGPPPDAGGGPPQPPDGMR